MAEANTKKRPVPENALHVAVVMRQQGMKLQHHGLAQPEDRAITLVAQSLIGVGVSGPP